MFYFCIRKAGLLDRLFCFSMKRIALISDTHGPLPDDVKPFLEDCDELWHAGDLGPGFLDDPSLDALVFRAVYGNIDDRSIRYDCPLDLNFNCEGVSVFMTHIGGYPGRYTKRVKDQLATIKPDLYICGHSHICKLMKDPKSGLFHINPGACGYKGFHHMRTFVMFDCTHGKIENMRLIELGPRTKRAY